MSSPVFVLLFCCLQVLATSVSPAVVGGPSCHRHAVASTAVVYTAALPTEHPYHYSCCCCCCCCCRRCFWCRRHQERPHSSSCRAPQQPTVYPDSPVSGGLASVLEVSGGAVHNSFVAVGGRGGSSSATTTTNNNNNSSSTFDDDDGDEPAG